MSKAKIIHIKESLKELKLLQRNQPLTIIKKLLMLMELKKSGTNGISKRQLATLIGVDPNSIQKWRTIYLKKAITGITCDGRLGFKPSLITKEEHKKIDHKLNQPENAIRIQGIDTMN